MGFVTSNTIGSIGIYYNFICFIEITQLKAYINILIIIYIVIYLFSSYISVTDSKNVLLDYMALYKSQYASFLDLSEKYPKKAHIFVFGGVPPYLAKDLFQKSDLQYTKIGIKSNRISGGYYTNEYIEGNVGYVKSKLMPYVNNDDAYFIIINNNVWSDKTQEVKKLINNTNTTKADYESLFKQ